MRIGEVIGSVTLNQCHPSLKGLTLRLAVPMTLDNLVEGTPTTDDCFAVVDQLGAGLGSRIAISESAEAAAPFRPELKPVDAYNAAILDHINLEQ